MITLNEVIAGYTPGIDILQGISLHVERAEIVTLLGPNGCGKSTLLKCIAGYLRPRRGQVMLDGQDVSQIPIHRKVRECSLGFVPQTDNVFNNLTIKENLQTGGQFLSDTERQQRMEALCERYPLLRKKWRATASALSGGERQILALTRALMPKPATLLLDEPSAGLSPKMLSDVFAAIQDIRRQEDVAILMVEQNAMEALHISDRAYVLALGKVALTGNADELLCDPRMRELYLGGRAA
ncbi:ABC transporter ATP-binding protein [Pectobacteriaceae bacterium CE70]|nr:ABC transporter ATP-binding protein [Prodigiosinella sp. LS101]WJV58751.1 ABC transporter ATP-binding protein [Pectobacteriaceae bacterium C111]WJV63066.1 ABC transporter ATP-binding protein [Pectobacteriaceae bacterium C52]WJV67388.1 ABC transporter ATP-binding protein [Pectobacteriaceae bacterium CE70]WJY11369.1 ABC transporter ATP-binding protein [Pectobacteriaceae bacterium C80]WJV54390.1 ABC transporter ATP-binding protein [Prodigiosinella sp. LS101]